MADIKQIGSLPVPKLIEYIERILEHAKDGKVKSFVGTAIMRNNALPIHTIHCVEGDELELVGALEVAKKYLLENYGYGES